MPWITSGRYAAVTSTLALVVALAGTSYAAVVITGHQIKDNTVTTKDIKNKTLLVKDFKPKTKARLTGPRGPMGPSDVFTVSDNTIKVGTGGFQDVLSLSLQPGSYTASGKSFGHRSNTGTVAYQSCRLRLDTTPIDTSGGDMPDIGGAYNTVVNTASFTITTATTLTLNCYITASAYSTDRKLTAIRVGTVTDRSGVGGSKPVTEPRRN